MHVIHCLHDFAHKEDSQLHSPVFSHCVACCYFERCIVTHIEHVVKGR